LGAECVILGITCIRNGKQSERLLDSESVTACSNRLGASKRQTLASIFRCDCGPILKQSRIGSRLRSRMRDCWQSLAFGMAIGKMPCEPYPFGWGFCLFGKKRWRI